MKSHTFELRTGRIERATAESCAFDLFYTGEVAAVVTDVPTSLSTGVRTKFSAGLRAQILEKSGLALQGLQVFGGVIDSDYNDEWKVIVRFPPHVDCGARGLSSYNVQPGQKIAQFVLVELPEVTLTAAEGAEISLKADQRTGGFGSTGLSS